MRIIIVTAAILSLLGLVHLAYGPGCWGLQPGGLWSAGLFAIQASMSIGALVYSLAMTWRHRQWAAMYVYTALSVAIAGVAVWQYLTVGWRMNSSIHSQGLENLPTFIATSLVAIIVGMQRIMANKGLSRTR